MNKHSMIHRLFLIMLCLSMIIQNFNIPFVFAGITPGTIDHIADGLTMDSYENLFKLDESSQYAGRVWSDKSVTTGNITLDMGTDGIDNVTISNDSDFMHIFSALGSSQVIEVEETVPMDVVFVLDISNSMITGGNRDMRMKNTMRALSKAIDDLNAISPYNRVGISIYADTGAVLLPLLNLVDYEDPNRRNAGYPEDGPQWFIEERNDSSDFRYLMNCKVRKADGIDKWSDVGSPMDYGAEKIGFCSAMAAAIWRDEWKLGYGTNLQSGLAAGLDLLATEEVTQWQSPRTGEIYDRVPLVIVMTDGGCNTVCVSNDASDTYSSKAWYDTKYTKNGNTNPEDNFRRYVAASVVPTLLTAAYNMARIKNNYAESPHAFGISVDTPGEPQSTKIHATLNPSDEALKAATGTLQLGVNDSNNAGYEYFKETNAYALIEEWKKGDESVFVGPLPNDGAEESKIYVAPLPPEGIKDDVNGGTVTMEDVIDNLYFTEGFRAVDGTAMGDVFSDIIKKFGDASNVFTPVGGGNGIGVKDALTYMDPIGKYMEVKDVKNLLLFGQLYNIVKDGDEKYYLKSDRDGEEDKLVKDEDIKKGEKYTYSIQNYKIDGNDETIENPCYGESGRPWFMLSEIKIYVKKTGNYQDDTVEGGGIESDMGYDQALYIDLPANALPMQVASILISDGKVFYDTNLDDKTQSTPLRVFYEVGIADEVKTSNNNIDMTKISPDYVTANSENGNVYFYSNLYNSDNLYTDYVDGKLTSYESGEPVLTFSPDEYNNYYIFQDYVPLTDASGNKIREMNANTIYRIPLTYYAPYIEISDAWLEQKTGDNGSHPGDTDSIALAYGETLCWYKPPAEGETEENPDVLPYLTDDKTAVRNPSEGYVIATKKGAVGMGDMSKNTVFKNDGRYPTNTAGTNVAKEGEHNTNTADTVYLPTYSKKTSKEDSDAIINVYLGNNGRLTVSNTQLLVTKTVENDDEHSIGLDEIFKYTIHLQKADGSPVTGEYSAIKATREDDETWRALIESIELLTNNKGLLLNNDNSIAVVDADGNPVPDGYEGERFYVYVGGEGADDNFTYTLFDTTDPTRNDSFHGILGTGKPLNVKAYLISADYYDNNDWSFDNDGYDEEITEFYLGRVGFDPGTQIGFAVHIDYLSQSRYQTQTLNFDANGNAEFTLKDGEGLLFIGLESGTKYTVTEIINDVQFSSGIRLKSINHKTDENVTDENDDGDTYYAESEIKNSDNYEFDDEEHTYSVKGNTNPNMTEKVHYFNYPPKTNKKQITPSDYKGYVSVGEEVTYEIYWRNDQIDGKGTPLTANITITDPLDIGADFISAEYENVSLTAGTAGGMVENGNIKIEYDPVSRTVKWTIRNVEPETYGVVRLTVKVNENAPLAFDYENGETLNEHDNKIINRAHTAINDYEFDTDIVETPVNEFHKTEVSVINPDGDIIDVNLKQDSESGYFVGPLVDEGWKINYEISFVNYKSDEATITITDRLDPDVEFFSASYEGVTATAQNISVESGNVAITYDPETRIVTWRLANIPANADGKVSLTVKVGKDSTGGGNQSTDDSMVFTNVGQTITEAGKYIMVYDTYAAGIDTSGGDVKLVRKDVEISEDTITPDDDTIIWEAEFSGTDSFYLKSAAGQYLKVTGTGVANLSFTNSTTDATLWSNYTTPGFLFSGNKYFAYYNSASTFSGYQTDYPGTYLGLYMRGMTFYKYDDSGDDPGDDPDDGLEWMDDGGNYVARNRAYVQVDNDEKQETETMENPLRGTLTVEKRILGSDDNEKEFEFTITLTLDGGSFNPSELDITGDITWEKVNGVYSGKGKFKLKNGESIVIGRIPYNVEYSVTESEDAEFKLFNITVNEENVENASGIIDIGKTDVIFYNAPDDYTPPAIELPDTGSKGIELFAVFGISLISAGILLIINVKKKNRRVNA